MLTPAGVRHFEELRVVGESRGRVKGKATDTSNTASTAPLSHEQDSNLDHDILGLTLSTTGLKPGGSSELLPSCRERRIEFAVDQVWELD